MGNANFMTRFEFDTNGGCWLWSGPIDAEGYGRATGGRAHRLSYFLHIGSVPAGLQLDHLCRVRCCINPNHLEPVEARVNTLRGVSVSAVNARKVVCDHGHPLTADNTALRRGARVCRACERRRSREYTARMGCSTGVAS